MHKWWPKKKLIKQIAEKRQQNTISKIPAKNISPRTLWGKIIVYLREHNNIILHIICGDITDVDIKNDVFIIKSEQKNIIDILSEPSNYNELKKAFEFFGYNQFEIKQTEKSLTDEDNIRILNKYFNNEVIVINKK